MSTTVSYKGATIATVNNQTKTLLTEGKYLEDDITLVDVTQGGGGADLGEKSVSANGVYNASDDSLDGYSKVTVAVPNSYSQSDEGKVVSNGALVAQGSDTVTENDTYDTTLISSLTVNVSGGGGSSAISLLDTITVPSDTRAVNVDLTDYQDYNFLMVYGNIELTASDWLYLVKNGSSPSGGSYSQSTTNHDGVLAVQFNVLSGCTTIASGVRANNSLGTGAEQMTNLYIYTYTSSKSIKAGSVIKVYGGYYADM